MAGNIKPSEVSEILKQQLAAINSTVHLEEVGTVLGVGDGVVRIYGLNNAEASELLEFENGEKAVVMNLEEDNVGAVLLGSSSDIEEGDTVKRTGKNCFYQSGDGDARTGNQPFGRAY